jgi:UDP-N-acetylglucosamine:LPS N-acetylglucosamine transferase
VARLDRPLVVVTDRGGHLHNALELLRQMERVPQALLTTSGPELDSLRRDFPRVWILPYLFSWWGKQRRLNPLKVLAQCALSFYYAARLRPAHVLSLGASDVVFFCYWAKLFGAHIYHVECMNQVATKSVTGRLLYPICTRLFVQWEDLRSAYGDKAEYAGWVLT